MTVQEARQALNASAKAWMDSPSRSRLEVVARDALEYLRQEHRLGSLQNIPWDDVNFSLGTVLSPALAAWRPDGGTEFRSYLLISVRRRCYRNLLRDLPSAGDALLDTIQGDASPVEPDLPKPPPGPLGDVVRAYVATYRAGDPPTPANLAMASGMPMRDVMRLLPLVRPWLRSGAIGSTSNGGTSRREPKGGERCPQEGQASTASSSVTASARRARRARASSCSRHRSESPSNHSTIGLQLTLNFLLQ